MDFPERGGRDAVYLLRFILLCFDMVNDFLGKNCQYIAGAVAFYTLFSMFPLVLAIVSIWGFFSGQEVERAALAAQMAEVIPVSSEFIGQTMSGVVSARAITGIVSVAAMVWASSTAFGAIRKGINTAWGVTRTRPFIRERLIDIGLAAGAGMLMVFLLFVAPMVSSIQNLIQLIFPDVSNELISQIVTFGLTPVIAFATFLVLYKYMPYTNVSLRTVWPGALVSSAAFYITNLVFIWYVNTFALYNAVYGAIGAMMALLTWVYVSAIILLFGALATSRFVRYVERFEEDMGWQRAMWTGVTRVRLRVVSGEE